MTRILIAFLLLGTANAALAQSCGEIPHRVSVLRDGARVDWSRSQHGLIAFDRAEPKASPYFDVYVMSLDNPHKPTCLTCGQKSTPGLKKHKGNPAWHPSGDYIVFQAETDARSSAKFANPGRGVNNVLWLTDAGGSWFVQLTPTSVEPLATGVLHPHFSEDGRKLSWTEQYSKWEPGEEGKLAGSWRLMSADFDIVNGRPQLSNVKGFVPMVEGFYENHGFSPDGKLLIFSSNAGRSGYLARINNDIFTLDPETNVVTALTSVKYNEHASYFPSGRKILWMTDRDVRGSGTELWVMNPGGTVPPNGGEQRLTFINDQACAADYMEGGVIVADSSVNAQGNKIVAFGQNGLLGDYGSILLIELDVPF
jgi:Tol biopolymer transport system component